EISENDIYGVSLLYHRAGILAAAGKKYNKAFAWFDYSAGLTHKQDNPASTCLNVINMAHALSGINTNFEINNLQRSLSKRDRQASRLLDSPVFTDPIFSAGFHNTMGVYWMGMRAYSPDEIVKTVKKTEGLCRAVIHFNKGLDMLPGDETSKNRKRNALYAALYLNKAIAASQLREKEHSAEYFTTALKTAKENMLPDLEWKALVGLGRLDEALTVLSDLTILRAGCRPFEIMDGFKAKVTDLVEANQAEEAFNLVERLSELERFHRMAFLFGSPLKNEKKLYQKLYPRILRISELHAKLEKATGEEKNYLTKQIKDEEELLQKKTGKENEKLPDQICTIQNRELRENVISLLGIAAEAEEAADEYVSTTDKGGSKDLRKKYHNLIDRYHEFREELIESRPEDVFSDAITFLGPEPVEAVDIMEVLEDDELLVRLYKGKSFKNEEMKSKKACVFSFIVTSEDIYIEKHDSFSDAIKKRPGSKAANVVYEDPEAILNLNGCSLSGAHFYRSIQNRKPFKKSIFSIPDSFSGINGYEITNLSKLIDFESPEIKRHLANMHTLILSGNILTSGTVPTRQGSRPDYFISYEDKNGNHIRIDKFIAGAKNLSLSILSETSFNDLYLIGHLFSIYGCPTVIVNKKNGQKFSESFLKEYSEKPASIALESALKTASEINQTQKEETIQLGYQGMTAEEADSFLNDYFIYYVNKGKTAFNDGRAFEAFSFFKHAAEIAMHNRKFQPLLPALLTYCRESAYLASDLESSAQYGGKLVLLLEKESPDTEKHAEALLRMGLILSRLEEFGKAIPMLDESVEILENLELDEKQISAMSELGALLENATEYDRALNIFKSAAEISSDMDKEMLLAKQFANMGRIYDLRLSQYAAALQNYRKALFIYRKSNKNAKSAQILLNIGRCYRLLGNFTEADSSYDKAFHLVGKKGKYTRLKAKIIIEQANNAWFQARYEEAFRLQRKALNISETCDDKLLKVISLNTSGLIWWTLGNNRKALHELEKALEIAKILPNRTDEVASTLNNIGLVLRDTGQYQKALDTFNQALALDKNLKSRWAIAYDLRNKALTLLKMERVKDAIPLFNQSAKESREIGNRINEAKALLGLSDALFEEGRYHEAESSYKNSLDLSEQMNTLETKWRAIYGLARIKLSSDP
ncbi:MAG: tetratricopeptide repeat protein, partial [Deltaproteobacteria bacterium]|nr:tetratricopeptide repeat protein [Deltaproteobacteria bacterium]